jgi:hypothetical protein
VSNPVLIKNFIADAAIPAYSLVKFGTSDKNVTGATAATDLVIGITGELPAALGERVDVTLIGIGFVVAGAATARGAKLTSDASSRAITAAPAAGSNVQVVGVGLEAAAAAGDVIRALISQSVMQG